MGDPVRAARVCEVRPTNTAPRLSTGSGRGRWRVGPAEVCQWRARGGSTATASGRVKVQELEPAGSLGIAIPLHNQDAEYLPEPAERHLVRHRLSALDSWHCSLLGLLLGMCAPGG